MDEDLDAFMEDHGKPCMAAGQAFVGILDQPDVELAQGGANAKSTMYALTVKTSLVAALSLKYGAALTVDGAAFTVREAERLDDGMFSQLNISKT
ncbi:hypothetical protein AAKU55_004917 [Oxalobacteraceae bacterium GrIS 1.11]